MLSKKSLISVAIGSTFAATLGAASIASAADNPFAMQSLDRGYMVADAGKMAEGKCGGTKGSEGKCGGMKAGEGKCGMSMMDTNKDGKISKKEFAEHHDAMFAKKDTNKDGFIDKDEMAKMKEGLAKMKDGKCGEAKCGADKAKK